ncbi:MAG: class I SAM-dependent methyltransferase [Phycisphaerae bacterium]|nr:class I SAM-dependent methyltransferase [Phycisphaerae bacterium]
MKCRACSKELNHTFLDLGVSPLSNSYLTAERLEAMEPHYPLKVMLCDHCWLAQLPAVTTPENIFSDYAYFSSFSQSWLNHARQYVEMMTSRFGYNENSSIVEIASNDGYLLQYFAGKNIPVLGIEPAENVAKVAAEKGIDTLVKFFGVETARQLATEGKKADLLLGNNVLAHVPDLNDFIAGMKILLNDGGVITMEFPHLARLMEGNQFDTIYHEHFSYFSFLSVEKAFARHEITLFDVEELPTHGGSLRIYGCHKNDSSRPVNASVDELRNRELSAGFDRLETYQGFAKQVQETKRNLLEFLIEAKRNNKTVVGYGAPAKGNTLLNYCGIRSDLLDYTVDLSPHKQGHFLPGTRIAIYSPEKISETKPDYVLILPWNLKDEICSQMAQIADWGGRFVVAIPNIEVI